MFRHWDAGRTAAQAANVSLLNVSYDPTREVDEEYNQAFAAYWQKKTGDKVVIKQVEIVVPSLSILAEPPATVVDKVVLRRGTRAVATEYLTHLYSREGQEIIARNFYRRIDPEVAAKYRKTFPQLTLVPPAQR